MKSKISETGSKKNHILCFYTDFGYFELYRWLYSLHVCATCLFLLNPLCFISFVNQYLVITSIFSEIQTLNLVFSSRMNYAVQANTPQLSSIKLIYQVQNDNVRLAYIKWLGFLLDTNYDQRYTRTVHEFENATQRGSCFQCSTQSFCANHDVTRTHSPFRFKKS